MYMNELTLSVSVYVHIRLLPRFVMLFVLSTPQHKTNVIEQCVPLGSSMLVSR